MNDANARAVAIGGLAAIARRGSGHALELRSNRNEVRSLKRRPRSAGPHVMRSFRASLQPHPRMALCGLLLALFGLGPNVSQTHLTRQRLSRTPKRHQRPHGP